MGELFALFPTDSNAALNFVFYEIFFLHKCVLESHLHLSPVWEAPICTKSGLEISDRYIL
jgi:hypothetical protein